MFINNEEADVKKVWVMSFHIRDDQKVRNEEKMILS